MTLQGVRVVKQTGVVSAPLQASRYPFMASMSISTIMPG